MEEIKNENQPIVEKKLKRQEFNYLDTAVACCSFIVMQIVFELLYGVLPLGVKQNFFVAVLVSVLVEAIFLAAVVFTSKTRNIEFINATKINKKINWKAALIAVTISIVCLICFSGLTNVFVEILYKFGYESSSSFSVPNLFVYFVYILLICVCPAIFEDILFRGCILSGLRKLGDKKAIILSALIFMLMHGGPDQTIHQFVIGIVLGVAFVVSGSLWVPIIIHFTNNFVALTMAYITRNAEVAEIVEPTWGQILFDLTYAVIFAVIGVYLIYFAIKALKKVCGKNQEVQIEEKQEEIINQETEQSEQTTTLSEGMAITESKMKEKKYTIIFYILAGTYLVFNWVLALIAGLL